MNDETDLRPRWGTFSVIDHKDPAALVPEILLYDRLVFPAPTEVDRERWEKNGWEPNLLDERIKELGSLAHPVLWTPELREEWSVRFQRLKDLGRETENLAMDLTPHVLSLSAWDDRIPPPIMIAAYQDPDTATADIELARLDRAKLTRIVRTAERTKLNREVRALFERRLEMPVVEGGQRTYAKAIELAHEEKYQDIRRRLFEWEDRRIRDEWPTQAAIKELEEIVGTHDSLVRKTFLRTAKQRTFHVLEVSMSTLEWVIPPAAGTAATIATGGNPVGGLVAALGARATLQCVKAILPSDIPDPRDSPGEALRRAISVMYHERSGRHS
jgi:hypothetical protein